MRKKVRVINGRDLPALPGCDNYRYDNDLSLPHTVRAYFKSLDLDLYYRDKVPFLEVTSTTAVR